MGLPDLPLDQNKGFGLGLAACVRGDLINYYDLSYTFPFGLILHTSIIQPLWGYCNTAIVLLL